MVAGLLRPTCVHRSPHKPVLRQHCELRLQSIWRLNVGPVPPTNYSPTNRGSSKHRASKVVAGAIILFDSPGRTTVDLRLLCIHCVVITGHTVLPCDDATAGTFILPIHALHDTDRTRTMRCGMLAGPKPWLPTRPTT
jgi:hypothetical protein